MKVVLNFLPIARGEVSKKGKIQVVGIVVDDLTKKDDKTGLYCSCQISAPVHVDFWCVKDIVLSLGVNKVAVVADVAVMHNTMNIRILQINYKGEFVDVSPKNDEEEE